MTRPSITWRLVFAYLILLAGILAIALLSSCGTRKKVVDTDIHNEKQTEKSIMEGNVKKESETIQVSSSKEEKAITQENQKTKTTEEFYPDGTLNKRTTETSNKKRVDNSKKEKNNVEKSKTYVDSIITNKVYRQMIIQDKKIDFNLDKDSTWVKNLGAKNIAFGLAILAVVLVVYTNWTKIKDWIKGKVFK